VESLNPITGWCISCSKTDANICLICGRETNGATYCATHRRSAWLERNADKIEDYIEKGYTVTESISKVRESNRPVCLSCGGVIEHGTGGRHFFCNKHDKCRKARRRYKYLIYDKGFNKEDALNVVLDKAA
jgi:hypothetical protein